MPDETIPKSTGKLQWTEQQKGLWQAPNTNGIVRDSEAVRYSVGHYSNFAGNKFCAQGIGLGFEDGTWHPTLDAAMQACEAHNATLEKNPSPEKSHGSNLQWEEFTKGISWSAKNTHGVISEYDNEFLAQYIVVKQYENSWTIGGTTTLNPAESYRSKEAAMGACELHNASLPPTPPQQPSFSGVVTPGQSIPAGTKVYSADADPFASENRKMVQPLKIIDDLRAILKTPEGESVVEHARGVMREIERLQEASVDKSMLEGTIAILDQLRTILKAGEGKNIVEHAKQVMAEIDSLQAVEKSLIAALKLPDVRMLNRRKRIMSATTGLTTAQVRNANEELGANYTPDAAREARRKFFEEKAMNHEELLAEFNRIDAIGNVAGMMDALRMHHDGNGRKQLILFAIARSRFQFTWSWLATNFGVPESEWPEKLGQNK